MSRTRARTGRKKAGGSIPWPTGLVGWWLPYGQASANDFSGNGHHLSNTGDGSNLSTTLGLVCNNDYYLYDSSVDWISTETISVCGWIDWNSDSGYWERPMMVGSSDLYINSSLPNNRAYGKAIGSGEVQRQEVTTEAWHFFCLRVKWTATPYLYLTIDSSTIGDTAMTEQTPACGAFGLGGYVGSDAAYRHDGALMNVTAWNRIISAAEIAVVRDDIGRLQEAA